MRCTWVTARYALQCKRLCRWPSDVCGIHIRVRDYLGEMEVRRLASGFDTRVKSPEDFSLWTNERKIAWLRLHQKKTQRRNPR